MKFISVFLLGLILLLVITAGFLSICGIFALRNNAEEEIFFRVYSIKTAVFALCLSFIWSLL